MQQALLISNSRPEPGVFESQVLEVGELFKEFGINYEYCVTEGLGAWITSRKEIRLRVKALARDYQCGFHVVYVPRPLTRIGIQLAAARICALVTRWKQAQTLIHARGPVAAVVALAVKSRIPTCRVLYDARGDSAAEARLVADQDTGNRHRRRWLARARSLERLERIAARGADQILSVSGHLRDQLADLSGSDDKALAVVPCCINPERFGPPERSRGKYRELLGLGNRLTFVFSGSLGTYQVPDRLAALFEAIQNLNPETHLLVLTKEMERARANFGHLKSRGLVSLVESDYLEVGRFLSAADVALLLRVSDPVNRVASPVKFAEYQSSGLPVVASPNIGDVSDSIQQTGYGMIIDLDEAPDAQARQVLERVAKGGFAAKREEIHQHALRQFTRSEYLGAYRALLDRLGVGMTNSVPSEKPNRRDQS